MQIRWADTLIYLRILGSKKSIVELQRAKQEFFKERSIFYASRAIEAQSKLGKWDYNWQAVYTIAIMDFEFSGMGHKNVKSDVILYDTENHIKFTEKLRFIYLEMPKFNKTEHELETNYDKWLYLLKHISELDEVPERLQRILFQKIFKLAEITNYAPRDRQEYEESLKEYRDYYNTLETAKKEERIQIATKMFLRGTPLEFIAEDTGLTLSEIEKIKSSL